MPVFHVQYGKKKCLLEIHLVAFLQLRIVASSLQVSYLSCCAEIFFSRICSLLCQVTFITCNYFLFIQILNYVAFLPVARKQHRVSIMLPLRCCRSSGGILLLFSACTDTIPSTYCNFWVDSE